MFDRTCSYSYYLEPGQKIWVYWRFDDPARRFNQAIVVEVADDYVTVISRGKLWKIGPEKEGDRLEYDYDKKNNLYLTGPFGLHATVLKVYYRASLYPAYGGRVYIHPQQTFAFVSFSMMDCAIEEGIDREKLIDD